MMNVHSSEAPRNLMLLDLLMSSSSKIRKVNNINNYCGYSSPYQLISNTLFILLLITARMFEENVITRIVQYQRVNFAIYKTAILLSSNSRERWNQS